MKIKKFLIIFLLYFLSINVAQSIQPDVFVQSTVNRASKVLSENISKDEKINELKKIALETVDIRGIGFYTLGSARKNLNDSQKQKYIEIFEKYFLKSFSSRLAEYTNPEIDVLDKKILSEKFEKWWTVSACYNEIDTLRDKYSNENDQEKLKFLDELNSHVMSIQKKYENS